MSDLDVPSRDLSLLAPKFRAAVEAAIKACEQQGLLVKVNEGFRSNARQAWLFAQGRTRRGRIVTNAPTSLTSWHGYGLAVDVIHRTKAYEPIGPEKTHAAENAQWFRQVSDVFKANDCNWGGDFAKIKDPPHMQWGKCRPSPSDVARKLMRTEGVNAVWRAVGAI